MATTEHVPLAEVKNRLSEVVERIERAHGRVIITKHGHPSAVIMSLEDLESLEETLAILSNPRLVAEIRQAESEIASGKSKRLSKDDALRLSKRR
ncbi:MAG: type II toxin-antitoxin system Phd/YefM family antitoxin [Actinomycetota bacterium]